MLPLCGSTTALWTYGLILKAHVNANHPFATDGSSRTSPPPLPLGPVLCGVLLPESGIACKFARAT